MGNQLLELKPIGLIHSPYRVREQAPYQGCESDEVCQIEVFKEYEQGLTDIDGFSHLIVIYWFHRSVGYSILVRTPWDAGQHGVFTTRSPNRPNPLGVSVVTLVARDGNVLKVKGLDAIDGTPVLDIKPYVPQMDQRDDVRIGWLEDKLKLPEKEG